MPAKQYGLLSLGRNKFPMRFHLEVPACCRANPTQPGFTRLELLVLLASLALLTAVALPVLAGNRFLSERVACLNNLRQIGQAFQLWANDRGEKQPWDVEPSQGGTHFYPSSLRHNPWFQFAWISNELVTPAVLVCPSDAQAKVAKDFSAALDGGFVNPVYRDNATSYFISAHSLYEKPLSLLSGDYNLDHILYPASCSHGFDMVGQFYPGNASWINGPHGQTGNILYTDGQVAFYSSPNLNLALSSPATRGNGAYHLLMIWR